MVIIRGDQHCSISAVAFLLFFLSLEFNSLELFSFGTILNNKGLLFL